MWRRDSGFWGYGNNNGVLNGRRSGKIDFRDQIGVYVLYDVSRRPAYISQAGQGNGVFSFDFELIEKTYLRNVGDISVGSVYLQ